MENTQNVVLREAENNFEVVGVLAEKKLEYKTFNGKDCITGTLTFQTGATSFIKTKVFSNRLTAKGEVSKAFTAFGTVMAEYKSVAEVGQENADRIRGFGKVREGKPFLGKDGEAIVAIDYNLSFVSRLSGSELANFEPKAKFTTEVFVKGLKDETKKDKNGETVETDRKVLSCVVPVYGGKVFPIDLILTQESGAIGFFEDSVETGSTVKVYCDLVNTTITEKSQGSTGGFGQKESKTFTKVVNERVCVGADEPYAEYDEDEPNGKAFSSKAITQALALRQETIDAVKNGQTTQAQPTGFTAPVQATKPSGFGSPQQIATPPVGVGGVELPF